jgi:putrescine carbamoyltransferase
MCDAIMARTNEHQTILDIAAYATVPVFNAMTVYNHPTQVLCDVLQYREGIVGLVRLSKAKKTFGRTKKVPFESHSSIYRHTVIT